MNDLEGGGVEGGGSGTGRSGEDAWGREEVVGPRRRELRLEAAV